MFRRWTTILGPEDLETGTPPMEMAAVDADVIMTAAVLGFSAGRLAVGHPVEFAVDHDQNDTKLPRLRATTVKINNALGEFYRFRGQVKATIAQPWQKGAVITGAAGASKTPFHRRHVTEFDPMTGPGAYTGFIVDPIHHHPDIQPTVRHNVPVEGYGSRWLPLGSDPHDGNVVGNTHGMTQAVYLAVQRGPWCTPFEIAAGQDTTKLASCFTCSLFMYAAGFPPSAIHIGQGNSWVPLYEEQPAPPARSKSKSTDPTTSEILENFVTPGLDPEFNATFHTIVAGLNNRWRLECRQHLLLGVEIMRQNEMAAIKKSHQPRLLRLADVLAVITTSNDLFGAANLILDAVTIHDHESARIDRTLC